MNEDQIELAEPEIKPGFKKTKLGWIPEDWEVTKISEFGKVFTGSTPDTRKPEYYGGDFLFVSPGDMNSGKYIDCTKIKLSLDGIETGRKIPKGAILFVSIGSTIGKTGIATTDLITNQQINAVVPNDKNNKDFIYQLLTFNSLRIKYLAATQAVPILSKSTFEKIILARPERIEQEKIANVLNLWDTAIENVSNLIQIKVAHKKWLMQQLLSGKKRLPGFSGEWKTKKIEEFSKECILKNKDGADITVLSCTKYDGLVPSLEYFGRRVFSENTATYKMVPRGCFAYATNHIEEGSIGYQNSLDNGLVSPMYTVFKTNQSVHDKYFYRVLKSHKMIYEYNRHMEGSIDRRGGLRWKSFSKIKTHLPPIEEQVAIEEFLSMVDKEIKLLKKKLGNLKKQKKGLMQVLLTGKKRLIK